jgi:hypothetical protein
MTVRQTRPTRDECGVSVGPSAPTLNRQRIQEYVRQRPNPKILKGFTDVVCKSSTATTLYGTQPCGEIWWAREVDIVVVRPARYSWLLWFPRTMRKLR